MIWELFQQKLGEQAQATAAIRQASDVFLAGKLYDDRGNRMTPTWAAKGGKRWRYYVSQAILQGRKEDAGAVGGVAAEEVERLIRSAVQMVLREAARAANPEHVTIGDQALRDLIQRATMRSGNIEVRLHDGEGIDRR